MITAWYVVVSLMLIVYVVLDGRNFGAGILHRVVARTPEERRQVVAAIGPLWPWHEVWLVGFGGTLVAVFPKLMASAFSGYYLALFLILWCLLLRGMALEVGGHLRDLMWQGFWDFVLVFSSVLLAILFGAAGGNLARGVPLDANQNFSMAFFSNFSVRGYVGLLDWYTISVAIFSTILLIAHGATYLVLKTEGPVHDRSVVMAKRFWKAVPPFLAIISLETWVVRPELPAQALANPVSWLGALVIAGSALLVITGLRAKNEQRTFLGSNLLIIGLLATGASTIFPVVLFSTLNPANSLTAASVAAPENSLLIAAIWWPIGGLLALAYFIFISRRYSGKVSAQRDTQGYY